MEETSQVDNGFVCSVCTFLNRTNRSTCEMCHHNLLNSANNSSNHKIPAEKSNAVRLKDKIVVKVFNSASTGSPRSASSNTNSSLYTAKHSREETVENSALPSLPWTCIRCTLLNEKDANFCAACHCVKQQRLTNVQESAKRVLPILPIRQCSEVTEALRLIEESEASEQLATVLNICKLNNRPFVDTTFPPNYDSIGRLSVTEQAKHPLIKWCRPYEVRTPEPPNYPWTVYYYPKPTDIIQGILGNCWFLSALAVLAERTELLEHVVVTRNICLQGAYQIRLCIDGRWTIILVDDLFPCDQSNCIVYSQARRKQLWVPLIEKALAKVYRCYSSLSAGRTVEGLAVLTGAPCFTVSLESDEFTGAKIDSNFTWASLLSAKEAGFLMGASCGAGRREANAEEYLQKGLYSKHAYSVLDLRDVHGIRLVKLRNPWGRGVWNGAWSEGSDLWTPEMRKDLQPEGYFEGVFWMPFEEFCEYFDTVDVCKIKSGCREVRLSGILPPHCLPGFVSATYVTIAETTEIDFTLYQSGIRNDVPSKHGVLDLCIIIFETDGYGKICKFVAHSGRVIKPFVVCNVILRAGSYVTFCLSFSHYGLSMISVEEMPKFTLALHSLHSATAQLTSMDPVTIADCLIGFILAQGEMHSEMSGVTVYYSPKKWCGLVIMVENRSPDTTVIVKCNCSDSENVVSTRGDLQTADVIPPWHRQVIIMLTQVEPTASYLIKHSLWYCQSYESILGKYAPENGGSSPHSSHYPQIDEKIYGLHICRPIVQTT